MYPIILRLLLHADTLIPIDYLQGKSSFHGQKDFFHYIGNYKF